MPRLMPIWQAAFDALGLWVDYVIAARHPLSVAESLAARDHLSREKSLMLWYEHSCRSMQWALHKGPWWSTTIDCWLCRDRNWAVLAIDFPCRWTSRLAPASSVMSWMSHCVTHPMMRARWLPQREAFRRCSRCMRHCSSLPWTGSTSKGGRAWAGIQQSDAVAGVRGELDRQLWQSASSHNESMTRFSEQVADLAMSCTAQRQLNDGLRDRLLEAGARDEQNERAMRELSRRLSACREELVSAQRTLAETDNLLRRTQIDRDDTHARLMAILDSRFWRFTKPLRNLSRLFGRETGVPERKLEVVRRTVRASRPSHLVRLAGSSPGRK